MSFHFVFLGDNHGVAFLADAGMWVISSLGAGGETTGAASSRRPQHTAWVLLSPCPPPQLLGVYDGVSSKLEGTMCTWVILSGGPQALEEVQEPLQEGHQPSFSSLKVLWAVRG